MIEAESDAVESLKKKVKDAVEDIKRKEDLLYDVDLTCNNFFMLLQKYKIDPVRVCVIVTKITTFYKSMSNKKIWLPSVASKTTDDRTVGYRLCSANREIGASL